MALSKIKAPSIADDSITVDQIADNAVHGRRNLVINGAMNVAQRATSTTSVSGGGYHACDRWNMTVSGRDDALFTVSQNTSNIVDGFSNSFKIETTTAESAIASDEYFIARQKVEAQNLQHLQYATSGAKSTTLSFWVKSSVAATFSAYLYKTDTTQRIIGGTYTINSANTWEYKTITFAGDTDSGATIPDDNGEGMHVAWVLAAGSNYTSTDNTSWADYANGRLAYGHAGNAVVTTANATWEITGVQWEVGNSASPFEHRSYGEELLLCQRYYVRMTDNTSQSSIAYGRGAGGGNNVVAAAPIPVPLRASPTITSSGAYHASDSNSRTSFTPTSVVASGFNKYTSNLGLYFAAGTSICDDDRVTLVGGNGNTTLEISAEL